MSLHSGIPLWTVVTTLGVGAVVAYQGIVSNRIKYPPGPKPWPLLGNIFDILSKGFDTERPWLSYFEWSKRFDSPLVHFSVLGRHVVVVNDMDSARDIFVKRGYTHASRQVYMPAVEMLTEIVGHNWNWGLLPPSHPTYKECRKESDIMLRPSGARKFRPLEMRMMTGILDRFRKSPERFITHCEFFTLAFNLDILYGFTITEDDHPLLEIAEKAFKAAWYEVNEHTLYPLPNAFPWLRFLPLPSWLPGMHWKKESIEWRRSHQQLLDLTFDEAVKSSEIDPDRISIAGELLRRQRSGESIEDYTIKSLAVSLLAAGSDAQSSSLITFILCMKMFPEIQEIARSQVDAVVGRHRLPTFEDLPRLPYLQAIIYEMLRLAPPAPLGVPHAAATDDIWEHNGVQYLIPAGAIVLGNIWEMTRDAKIYPNPRSFNPTRFLNADGSLNSSVPTPEMIFGFRPRMCPGKWIAEDLVYIFAATMLSQFIMENPKGKETLTEDELEDLWKPGFVRVARHFECNFIPRKD
ncbi:cytochrome P450 [Flagelloscypha sp. PMI_526]|nr:cytochrome P450 [Flagelloscypha sp. PMI_526]